MKHNWAYKKLGDICSFERGVTYSKEDESDTSSDVIILRSNNIDLETYSLNFLDLKYLNNDFQIKASKKLRANTILICISNGSLCHLGKTAFVDRDYDMAFGGFMGLIIPNSQNPKYLSYVFRSPLYYKFLDSLNRGANIRNIQFTKLSKLLIPIPPIAVQEQIVAELDKINETIEDCRELLCNLDALKLSLFYDYFGDPNTNPKNWNISTFGEIGTFIRGGGFLKRDFVDFGIPCIHYGQIHTKFGEVVRKNLTYISEYTALKSKFAKPNDVILAITSEDLEGSCKSVAWLGDFEVAVGGHAAIFTHNQNPVFISFYTRSNAFCIEKEKYAHGSKVVEIRPKDIEKIPIYLPPLELQEKFAERIEQIEAQKKTVENTIAELQTLLDSRMDYWFN